MVASYDEAQHGRLARYWRNIRGIVNAARNQTQSLSDVCRPFSWRNELVVHKRWAKVNFTYDSTLQQDGL